MIALMVVDRPTPFRPRRLVVTEPKRMPKISPPRPPISGMHTMGMGRPALISRMAWTATYPPRPK
jgi:hypothetical protein